jgi:Cu+-exporting ATPase
MARDPVCGMTVEPDQAAGHAEHEGQTYYFCSLHCLDRFRAQPTQYVTKAVPAGVGAQQPGRRPLPMMQPMPEQPVGGGERDPVCGMTVQPATAAGSHIHEQKTYYFCCQGCLAKFRADPVRYLSPASAVPEPKPLRQFGGKALPMLGASSPGPSAAAVIDPVCGMTVDPATAAGSFAYEGHDLLLLLPRLSHQVSRRPRSVISSPASAQPTETDAHSGRSRAPSMSAPCVRKCWRRSRCPCPKCGMALGAGFRCSRCRPKRNMSARCIPRW